MGFNMSEEAAMKILLSLVLVVSLMAFSWPGHAGEMEQPYDTSMRMVFGLGYGAKSVQEEDFTKFAREVVSPVLMDGFCMLDARGQWMHPEQGLVRERNVLMYVDYVDSPEMEAKFQKIIQEYLRRFPGSNAAVYTVRTTGIAAKIYFQ
jgi:hypothetical protein